MMFNPITNQPLSDYKSQQEQMQKEREKKINELYNLRIYIYYSIKVHYEIFLID